MLRVALAFVAVFVSGLVTAGVVAGAGPLATFSAQSSSTDDSTSGPTSTDTTGGTTSTETTTGAPPETTTDTAIPDTAIPETTTTDTTATDTTATDTTATDTTTESSPEPHPSPTVASDKDDYLAGSTVTLAGKNWAPHEAVHIFVNDDAGQSWSYATDVSADDNGDFTLSFQLPNWFVALYRVTATGASGATASTTFTDLALNLYATTADRSATSPAGPNDLVFKQGDTVYAKLNALNAGRYYRIQVLDNTSAQVALTSCTQGTTDPQTLDYALASTAAVATWQVRALRWNSSGCGGNPDATDATLSFFVVTLKTFSDASCTDASSSFSAAGTVYLKGTGWPFNRNNITVTWTRPNTTTVSSPTGNDRPDTSGSGTWNACVGFGSTQNGSSLAAGNWTVKATSANDEFTSAAFVVAAADTTPPSITCSVPNQAAWHANNVTVACTASDSGSGLANPGADASFSLATAVATGSETTNAQTNSRQVCDGASPQNCATAGPYTFKVDKKAPEQSSCDPPDGAWHADDVTLKCTYTDGGSGPASQLISLSTNVAAGTEDANASASANGTQACDAVNNCAASPDDIAGNKVDKKAPSYSCGSADSFWHANDVSIACTANDGGSGLADSGDSSFNLVTTVPANTEDANASTGSRVVKDAVGNQTTAGPIAGNKVDKKAPTVTLTCPATVILGSAANANWVAADGGSGVALGFGSGSVPLDTSSIGAKTATVPAGSSKDNVDNLSAAKTCSYSVIFNFHGFFQPVDNTPTVNRVNAGSAVPVKFDLSGDQGLNIFASGYPKTKMISCTDASPLDDIESTVTAGGSSLSYGNGQYVYVWKTEKSWAGQCRELDVLLTDGTMHSAKFRFK